MNAALRAHIHLLETLPRERIRTHEKAPVVDRKQGTRLGPIPRELVEEVWALLKLGLSKPKVLADLHMGQCLFDRIHAILLERMDANERRNQIQKLSATGLSERRIAFALGVSRTTVQNHLRAINAANR